MGKKKQKKIYIFFMSINNSSEVSNYENSAESDEDFKVKLLVDILKLSPSLGRIISIRSFIFF